MSSENSLMMVGRPSRFGRLATTQLARPSPASPMVLQVLMQSIMDLNQKVDALALSSPRSVVVRDVQPVPEEVGPQSTALEVRQTRESQPTFQPEVKVNRSRLLDIFD